MANRLDLPEQFDQLLIVFFPLRLLISVQKNRGTSKNVPKNAFFEPS